MQRLKTIMNWSLPPAWHHFKTWLEKPDTNVNDSLHLLAQAYPVAAPDTLCYQGELRLDEVADCAAARIEREKIMLRIKLAQELEKQDVEARNTAAQFDVTQSGTSESNELPQMEITLDDIPIAPPPGIKQLLTSIYLDLGATMGHISTHEVWPGYTEEWHVGYKLSDTEEINVKLAP